MHSVTGSELDTVASLSNSVDLAFLGMSFGALITLVAVDATVPLTTAGLIAGMVSGTIIAGLSSLVFGVRAWISYREAQNKLREIKLENLPPMLQ